MNWKLLEEAVREAERFPRWQLPQRILDVIDEAKRKLEQRPRLHLVRDPTPDNKGGE